MMSLDAAMPWTFSGSPSFRERAVVTELPGRSVERLGRRHPRTPFIALTVLCLAAFSAPAPALATGSFQELDGQVLHCDAVLNNVLNMPDSTIPKDLLQRCRGLAIFPGVLKIGLVFGVSSGSGVILRRDERTGQWSRPAFFRIRGGSFGAQVGVHSVDLILLIMSDIGLEALLEDKFTLGADATVAAGPIGRDASAETNLRFDSGILGRSVEKAKYNPAAAPIAPDPSAHSNSKGKPAVSHPSKEATESRVLELALRGVTFRSNGFHRWSGYFEKSMSASLMRQERHKGEKRYTVSGFGMDERQKPMLRNRRLSLTNTGR